MTPTECIVCLFNTAEHARETCLTMVAAAAYHRPRTFGQGLCGRHRRGMERAIERPETATETVAKSA